jgi:ATP-dependent Zn protease
VSKASNNHVVNNHGSVKAPKFLESRLKVKRTGVHEAGIKTNYPNLAFKQHNEIKMLARLQRNVDSEIQELLPEAIEQARRIKEQRQQQMQKQLMQPVRKYGQMLTGV